MENKVVSEWDQKWEEVGAIWKNEKSMSLKLSKNASAGDNLLITQNKSENEKAPVYRVWKKR